MPRLTICLLLLVLGIFGIQGFVTPELQNVDDLLARNVYLALDKMLDFFRKDYSSINLDGLFGLRLGQG
ncbi:hypothetical protein CHS0354_014960, partial [Potamilus streckersoni]